VLLLIHCHPLQAKYFWPYVIESRRNDLNDIANASRRRKKRQMWQVTTHGFSKECKLTVDSSDIGVCSEMQFVFKTLTKIIKNNPQLKKMACPIVAIMMYMSSIRDVY
jgi:hypothetical protein